MASDEHNKEVGQQLEQVETVGILDLAVCRT